MKKVYLATLVVMVAGLIAMPSVAQANLLTNPGFEDGFTGWSKVGEVRVETWDPHSGGHVAAISATWYDPPTGTASQQVSVTEGLPYVYNLWGLGDAATTAYFMKLKWYNASNSLLREDSQQISIDDTAWSLHTLTATAPTGSSYVEVAFGNDVDAPCGKFDDVSFEAIPEPTSLLLLGTGLVGLFGFARRKRRVSSKSRMERRG